MDNTLKYSLANLYQKARDLYTQATQPQNLQQTVQTLQNPLAAGINRVVQTPQAQQVFQGFAKQSGATDAFQGLKQDFSQVPQQFDLNFWKDPKRVAQARQTAVQGLEQYQKGKKQLLTTAAGAMMPGALPAAFFGGAFNAAASPLTGQNPFEAAGSGAGFGLQANVAQNIVNPLVSKGISKILPGVSPLAQRAVQGAGNVLQGGAASVAAGGGYNPQNAALDFATGAILSGEHVKTTDQSNLIQKVHPDDVKFLDETANILGGGAQKGTPLYQKALKDLQALADVYLPKSEAVGRTETVLKKLLEESNGPRRIDVMGLTEGKSPESSVFSKLYGATSEGSTGSTQLPQIQSQISPSDLNSSLATAPKMEPSSVNLGVQQPQSLGQDLPQQGTQSPAMGLHPEVSSLISTVKNKVDALYTKSMDRFHPLSQIAKQGGEETAMRNALTGYYGSASTANYHVDFQLAPILEGVNPADLRQSAIAQRDLELAGRQIQGSPKQKDAQVILDGLKAKLGPEGFAKLQETTAKLHDYQDNLVRTYLVDTGVLSPKAYDEMVKNNQSYVPFKRVMDQVDEHLGFTPTKQAGSVSSQNVIKGIKGSDKEVIDPLQSIVENTYKIVGLGQRQKVAQTIVNLQDKLPPGVITKLGEATNGEKATISLFQDGKVIKYKVPQEISDAAKGMSEDQMGTLVKILSVPTKIFRATATGYNPEFMLPNTVRDLQSAFVNVGLNPLKFVKGLASLIKQDDLYQEYLKSGGQVSSVSLDQPFLRKTVADITGEKGLIADNPRLLTKVGKNVIEFLQTAGEWSEQPTRIAAFDKAKQAALKAGKTLEQAQADGAYAAQEATVNFARRGSETRTLNSVYAFLNARAQGTDRLIRSLKNDPKGAGVRLGAITVVPSVALYMNNRRFKSYNDPRILTQNDKDNNFIIMFSDTPVEKLGGAQFIKIPKGEVGKLANPVESFLTMVDGKGGDVQQSLLTALKSFSPIDNEGDLAPTAVRPILEDRANKNFFYNTEIVPSYKQNYPAGQQDTPNTAPLFRAIGQATNMSPARLQNAAEGYGTGATKIVESLTAPFLPGVTTPKNQQGADINKTPVVRRFLGGEKKSVEDAQMSSMKQLEYLNTQTSAIRNAMLKGDIPTDQGNKKIQELQDQADQARSVITPVKGNEQSSNPFVAPVSASEGNSVADKAQISDIKAKIKFGVQVTDSELEKAFIGNITPPNDSSAYNKAVYEDKLYKAYDSIKNSSTLTDAQKVILTKSLATKLGVDPQQFDYYNIAKQSSDLKSLYANEQLSKLISSGVPQNQVFDWLIQNRKSVNGQQLLTSPVIDSLVQQNIISKADGAYLKKIEVTPQGQVKSSAKARTGKKIKMPKLKVIKPRKVKAIKIKPIKLKLNTPKKIQ